MDYFIREMKIEDYDELFYLWEQTDGLSIEEDDNREGIDIYLKRNSGLCFVACAEGVIIGSVLCGHEGRRGNLRHLAVKPEYRSKGIARALINQSLTALAKEGIKKCNTFVLDENKKGRFFWGDLGWNLLEDNFRTMQSPTDRNKRSSINQKPPRKSKPRIKSC